MLRDDHLSVPDPRRLSPGHRSFGEIMRRHAMACTDGSPTYRDPVSGFAVFTATFLAQRGACCESGCRHCPFIGATRPEQ